MIRPLILVPLILSIVCACGCALKPPPRLHDESYREEPPQAAAELASTLRTRAGELSTLRSLWETTISHSSDSYLLRHAIVLRAPEQIRVETLPMTAAYTISLLIAGPDQVVYLDVAEKKAYFGSVQKLTKRLLHVPLSLDNLGALATGRIPSAAFAHDPQFLRSPGGAQVLVANEGRSEWLLNEERLVSKAQVYGGDGTLDYQVAYLSYSEVGGIQLPEKIVIELPRLSVTLEMVRTAGTVNKAIPDKLFQVAIPSDYQRLGE